MCKYCVMYSSQVHDIWLSFIFNILFQCRSFYSSARNIYGGAPFSRCDNVAIPDNCELQVSYIWWLLCSCIFFVKRMRCHNDINIVIQIATTTGYIVVEICMENIICIINGIIADIGCRTAEFWCYYWFTSHCFIADCWCCVFSADILTFSREQFAIDAACVWTTYVGAWTIVFL